MTASESPPEYRFLETLVSTLEKNLTDRIAEVKADMNMRMDKFERKMDEYVLEAVFNAKVENLHQHITDVERKAEAAKEHAEAVKTAAAKEREEDRANIRQRVTWSIAGSGVFVAIIAVTANILTSG